MRILAISGSPRGLQSSSRRLLEGVLRGAQSAGAETELVDLGEIEVTYCLACGACHVRGICPRKDDFATLREKILGCDGLALGSPVYFDSVTAQLKTVMDRLSDAIHCQLLLGKHACSVVTAGGSEYDQVIDYMNGVLVRLGCYVTGGIGASMSEPGLFETAEGNAVTLGRDLVQAIEEKRTYPDQDAVHAAMHERFRRLVAFNKAEWPHEYNYWVSRGWL